MNDLPILTEQQQDFLLRYFTNKKNAFQAYKLAYNCVNMQDKTAYEEASKLLNHPKITPWVEYYTKSQQEVFEDEIKYTIKDAFQELNDLQKRCKDSSKTYGVEKGCIENKCKLAGLLKDEAKFSGGLVVQMGEVKAGGSQLDFEIGAENGNTDTT